jgi:PIN domain nuclease of toxin-antitoxin system
VIHLDTHVVLWLFEGRIERLSAVALGLLRTGDPLISPMVRVELALLHEVGRVHRTPATILDAMRIEANLRVAEPSFERVSAIASTLTWTRDPFDRLIVAHAMADDLPLLTKDRTILANAPIARWDR